MNLYVWEDALSNWTPGMIVALAPDLRAAKDAVREAFGRQSDWLEAELKTKPQVIRITDGMTAQAWTVCGGDG